jgi:hypothetical protein
MAGFQKLLLAKETSNHGILILLVDIMNVFKREIPRQHVHLDTALAPGIE